MQYTPYFHSPLNITSPFAFARVPSPCLTLLIHSSLPQYPPIHPLPFEEPFLNIRTPFPFFFPPTQSPSHFSPIRPRPPIDQQISSSPSPLPNTPLNWHTCTWPSVQSRYFSAHRPFVAIFCAGVCQHHRQIHSITKQF
jgi:hypothetical protein